MKYLLTLLSILLGTTASAQLFPSRSFILAPAFRDKTDTTTGAAFLTQTGMWGNLSRGFGSEGERFAWDISFGGFFELVQWQQSGISFVGDFEILSDIYNNISFNPRSIFWTEGLIYSFIIDSSKRGPHADISFGYIHRCKHDIDNLGDNTVGSGEERTLIYGSAMLRFVLHNVSFIGVSTDLAIQLDQYLIRQDDRNIEPTLPPLTPDVKTINSSLAADYKIGLFAIDNCLLYLRQRTGIAAFDSYSYFTLNLRAELGLQINGKGFLMDIFAGAEGFSDDYNRRRPTRSGFFYAGFRFLGKNVGL